MSKTLSIIVAGEENSGKSTMLLLIEKLLKENGFEVELLFDGPDYTGENSFYFHNKEKLNFNEKVEDLKKNIKISLKESQTFFDTQERKDKIKDPHC